MQNLKYIELKYGKSLAKIVESNVRVDIEIEVDCFLLQILRAVDCLLVQINDKLGLGIPLTQIGIDRVQSELYSKTKKIDLLTELDKAKQYGNWYWLLKELRDHSLITSLVYNVGNEENKGENLYPTKIYFPNNPLNVDNPTKMSLEIIPFLEQSLNHVKNLIEHIKNKNHYYNSSS